METDVSKLSPGEQWPFAPRVRQADDENMIYSNWIASLRGNPPYREMRHSEYQHAQRAVINEILARPNVEVLVACHPTGEPRYGWLCYEWTPTGEFILHYVYVQKMYRQKKIATALILFAGCALKQSAVRVTSWTKALSYQRERWKLTYNPFQAWRQQ